MSGWYESTTLGDECSTLAKTHCTTCQPNGSCDDCDTIDGRCMEAVNEYASSCDGCGELTSHCTMEVFDDPNLGYCEKCAAEARTKRHPS